MRKPAFCICKNKGAYQISSNRAADQNLCFSLIDSTMHLLSQIQNFMHLVIFYDYTTWFVSDQAFTQSGSKMHDISA